MSRRIDIELTSSLSDGTWTWRAAGARQPRGVLDGAILPGGSKVGDELKVEVEQELDGIKVLSVVANREKQDRDLLTLLPVEREFQPVIETRARHERGERPKRDADRRPRGDGDERRDDRRRDKSNRDSRDGRNDRSKPGDKPPRSRDGGRDSGRRERRGPSFTPPPEVPQRPKPKRLRPGKAHRTAVLADLPPEQRPIAELALQGMGAVRTRLKEENEKAVAEGRPVMPEATVLKMAEELLPTLRVAEWRDRAEAAKEQAAELDLRDLRSVVAASGDPMVARDESTRALADELKQVLATKQEQELQFWYGDIDAALAVGRVIRALRLSSQPPKAGVPFPSDIAQRLADSTNTSLTPMDAADRWSAMLEAAAFSPIRTLVRPPQKPDAVSDELTATVTRLAPALPHVAELFGIEVAANASMPKPLRPAPRGPAKGKPGETPARAKHGDRPPRGPKPKPDAPKAKTAETPEPTAQDATDTEATEVETPVTNDAPEAEAADTSAPEAADTPEAEPDAAAAPDGLKATDTPEPEAPATETEPDPAAAPDAPDATDTPEPEPDAAAEPDGPEATDAPEQEAADADA